MTKRTFADACAQNLEILLKIWVLGEALNVKLNVWDGAKIKDLRNYLNEKFNKSGNLKLLLIQENKNIPRSKDETPIKLYFGNRSPKQLLLPQTFHAFFQKDNFSNMRLPAIKEDDSKVSRYFNVVKILNKNAQQCAIDAKHDACPLKRQKLDTPDEPMTNRPKVKDYVSMSREVSKTLRTLSDSIMDMSDQLEKQTLGPQTDEGMKLERLIQNNMDSCRYLAPVLKGLASLNIPIVAHGDEIDLDQSVASRMIIKNEKITEA